MNLVSPAVAFALVLYALAFTNSARAQVVLPQLDPVALDTTYQSINSNQLAMIEFVNLEPFSVAIYWIDYSGTRVLYNAELTAGASFLESTFLTHPWVVAQANTGATLDQGSGVLVGGYQAQTANPQGLQTLADIAYIGALPVPEPTIEDLLLAGAMPTAAWMWLRRRQRRASPVALTVAHFV
jgi:hypothetical protein